MFVPIKHEFLIINPGFFLDKNHYEEHPVEMNNGILNNLDEYYPFKARCSK